MRRRSLLGSEGDEMEAWVFGSMVWVNSGLATGVGLSVCGVLHRVHQFANVCVCAQNFYPSTSFPQLAYNV